MQQEKSIQVYWERQGMNRLCGLNCVNSLLQGPYFTEMDMINIALSLDQVENALLGQENRQSENLADDGNYSIQVISESLQQHGLVIESIDSEVNKANDMTGESGFICNSDSHWFCIRKVGNVWYNLNSTNAQGPQIVSDFYLSAFLLSIRQHGYTIMVVKGTLNNYHSQSLQSHQEVFTAQHLYQVNQNNLKNKNFSLNISGSEQAALQQALQNSLKDQGIDYNDQQQQQQQQQQYFQGQGVALQSVDKGGEMVFLQEKYQEIMADPQMLQQIQLSLEHRFTQVAVQQSNQILLSVRLPEGRTIKAYFNPHTTILNDVYDYVIYEYRPSQCNIMLKPFVLMTSYPSDQLTNIYLSLSDLNITTNTRLSMFYL